MSKAMIIEAIALYWPITISALLYFFISKSEHHSSKNKRTWPAILMSSVWVSATLPWVNEICVSTGFWEFQVEHHYTIQHLPLSLYLGWVVLWGVLPVFIIQRLHRLPGIRAIPSILICMLILDLVSMPLLAPVMTLHDSSRWFPSWVWGELLLIIICLLPSLILSKFVIDRSHLYLRSTLISSAFVMLLLVVLPLSQDDTFSTLVSTWRGFTPTAMTLWGMLLLLLSLPGISGVIEFAKVGKGTPIPYDPPSRLVTSGVYSYISNPIQFSMTAVLLPWAYLTHSWIFLAAAGMAIIYCVGIAKWSEGMDLTARYGTPWQRYRSRVNPWLCSILPTWTAKKKAQIYIDMECSMCRSVAKWIRSQQTLQLEIIPASKWKGKRLTRITYLDPNSEEQWSGVEAMGRVFQHIHIAWAYLGWFITLPGLSFIIQAAMDAAGAGAQTKKQPF